MGEERGGGEEDPIRKDLLVRRYRRKEREKKRKRRTNHPYDFSPLRREKGQDALGFFLTFLLPRPPRKKKRRPLPLAFKWREGRGRRQNRGT